MKKKMKIAVVGTGISGLSSAWLMSKKHDIYIFEKNDYIGGHSNTQTIITKYEQKKINVDTGFIVLSLIHISEPTRRTPISYAVFCLKKRIQEG